MDRARNMIRLAARTVTTALALAIVLWMGVAGAEIEPVFAHEVAPPAAHAATSEHGATVDGDADDSVVDLDLHRPKRTPGIAPYFLRSARDRAAPADAVQLDGPCSARGARSLTRAHARILTGC